MFLSIASSVALAALSGPVLATPVHSAQIEHASNAYTAAYATQSTLHLNQVNPVHAMREVQPRCNWKADLVVHRSVEGVAALSKSIHQFAPLAGTYAGSCTNARGQIEAEIARASQARSSDAVTVAQQDRAVLVNELNGIHAMTAKGA